MGTVTQRATSSSCIITPAEDRHGKYGGRVCASNGAPLWWLRARIAELRRLASGAVVAARTKFSHHMCLFPSPVISIWTDLEEDI